MNANTIEAAQTALTEQPSMRTDPWILTGPVLVATDGTEASDAALRVAATIARDHALAVHTISVVAPPFSISASIAAAVVAAAREIDASLIVLGLGTHRPVDRVLGDEIAAQVVRRASIPVLAVPADAAAPLRRAVVGIDFSRASIRAARAAVSLTTPPGHVWLAHVKAPLELPTETYEGASIIYAQGVLGAFKKMEERLEAVELLEVRPAVLEGKVADELLAFAASHRADLLVTGAHGRTLVERLLIGSVTTKILRAARCSVLVIPPHRRG